MANDVPVSIIYSSKNAKQATAEAKGVRSELAGVAKGGKDAGQGAKEAASGLGNLKSVAISAAAGLAAIKAVQITAELVQIGAAAQQAEMALNALSDGRADEYVKAIASASQYTISSMDAMSVAARSLRMGIVGNADDMARLTQVAMVMGQTMGIGTTQALNDLSTGIARQSKLILDNLGIIVDTNAIQEDANRLMAEDAALTKDAAQQKAYLNAVLAEGDALLAQTGGVMQSTATDVEVLKASFTELRTEAGKALAEVFGPAIKNAADLSRMLRELKTAQEDFARTTAYTVGNVDDWVIGMANAGLASQELAHQIEAGIPPAGMAAVEYAELTQQFWELRRAEAELAGADVDDKLYRIADASRLVAEATQEVTEETISEEEAVRRAEQAHQDYINAIRKQYNEQRAIAGITADLVGQFDTLGRTFTTTVVDGTSEAALMALRYEENVQGLSERVTELTWDIQLLGDGEGALGEELATTQTVLGQQAAAMEAARAAAGGLQTTYTITQLTQEQLNLVGESFIDLLGATGNELLMTGQSYDDYRLKMALATEEQIRMEHGQATLMEALEAGRLSAEQAGDVYTGYVTGQIADVEAAIATQEAHNAALAEVPGLINVMQSAGLGEIFTEVAEPAQTVAEQFGIMSGDLETMAEIAPVAFETMAELAPGTNEAVLPLQENMTAIAGAITGMTTAAPTWAKALNEAGLAVASEGSGIWQGASLISGMYSDWLYLQKNSRLELEALVTITTLGSIPGAAGGAHFYADRPQMILVGEAGRERVDVTPQTPGPHPPPVSGGIPMFASGGSMTAGSGGGTAYVTINVTAGSGDPEAIAEKIVKPLRRELRNLGFDYAKVA